MEQLDRTISRLRELQPVIGALIDNTEAWFESLPFPAWLKSTEGQLLVVNQAYADFYGKTRSDCLNKDVAALLGPENARRFTDRDRKVLDQNKPLMFHEKIRGGRHVTVLKFPVTDGHEIQGVGGMILNYDRPAGVPRLVAERAAGAAKARQNP